MDPIGELKWNLVRRSMGQTLTVSKRINLAKMLPRKDLASSGYCLANPGVEYLVYLPSDQRNESRLAENFGRFRRIQWSGPLWRVRDVQYGVV